MAGIASGARTQLLYQEEAVQGQTPGPIDMKILRSTGRNVNLQKNILESDEIRPTRQIKDVRHGLNRVEGDVPAELSLTSYDDMIEAAMSGTWAAVTMSAATDLSVVNATSTITRASGSWLTDGFRPGDIVVGTNFVNGANNAQWRILTVTASDITVYDPTSALVDEANTAAASIDLVGERVDIGLTLRTFTFERGFTDAGKYQVFNGVAVNTMAMTIQPEAIVGITLGLLGLSAQPMAGASLDATPQAAGTNDPFSSFDGALFEGNNLIAIATGLDFTLDNQRSLEGVIGSKFSPCVFEGVADVTGTLTAFFEDETVLNKFINETLSSLYLRLDDLNGTDFMNFVFPAVKYTGGDMDPPQLGPIPLNMPFRALEATLGQTSITIQKSNV